MKNRHVIPAATSLENFVELDYSLYTKDMHYISHSFPNTWKAPVEAIQVLRFKCNQLRVT